MVSVSPLHEQLNCFGYFGFAVGFEGSRRQRGSGSVRALRSSHCNQCPLKEKCWEAHKDRVRRLVPAITKLVDAWPEKGTAYLKRAAQLFGPNHEPYSLVMLGNIEDGALIEATGKPKDRAESTLSWPLLPIAEMNPEGEVHSHSDLEHPEEGICCGCGHSADDDLVSGDRHCSHWRRKWRPQS